MASLRITAWHLIVAGVCLNIVSALLTNSIIDRNVMAANTLERATDTNQQRISQLWQQIQDSERKRDSLIGILAQSELLEKPLTERIEDYFLETLETYQTEADSVDSLTLEGIDEVFTRYQATLRQEIDATYLRIIEGRRELAPIESRTSFYRNLAVFLQMLGLILILGKDLSRPREQSG
jgi:hypothetical protein